MLNKRTTDVLRWLAVLCGLVALWSIAGPAQIGGPVSIAVTRGVSMEPVFSSGDLVLVRETNRVSTGDIILYRSEQTGQDVLHRVIAVSGDQYVVKGDNNGWVDEDRPTLADITGVYWGHMPGAGEWLSKLKSPVASAAFGGVFLVLFGISLPPARAQDAVADRRCTDGRAPRSTCPRRRPRGVGVPPARHGARVRHAAVRAFGGLDLHRSRGRVRGEWS